MAVINNELGAIQISADVIAMLVGKSAEQCYGIVGMAAKRAADGLAELLNWENITRGVKIKDESDGIIIEMYVIMEYGLSISAVAESTISNIKYNVESMTGLHVKAVNITVEGIRV